MTKKRRTKSVEEWASITAFFLILLFLLALLENTDIPQKQELQEEKDKILQAVVTNDLTDNNVAFVIKDKIDKDRLSGFASMSYEEIKAELGIKKDFAIYFSNGDNTLLPIGGKFCIGSPKAKVGGVSCG